MNQIYKECCGSINIDCLFKKLEYVKLSFQRNIDLFRRFWFLKPRSKPQSTIELKKSNFENSISNYILSLLTSITDWYMSIENSFGRELV